jgi:hypothetical protein
MHKFFFRTSVKQDPPTTRVCPCLLFSITCSVCLSARRKKRGVGERAWKHSTNDMITRHLQQPLPSQGDKHACIMHSLPCIPHLCAVGTCTTETAIGEDLLLSSRREKIALQWLGIFFSSPLFLDAARKIPPSFFQRGEEENFGRGRGEFIFSSPPFRWRYDGEIFLLSTKENAKGEKIIGEACVS